MKRAWWLNLLAEGTTLAPAFLDYIRLNRQCARDIMVSPAVIAPETASVATIADLLAQHRIKRVPIMRDKTMVGIVSRADIVRAMARMPQDDLADF
jgi:CBS domain-containing protein